MLLHVIGVVLLKKSFRDYYNITQEPSKLCLGVHRQVCCDKIPAIAVKMSMYGKSRFDQFPPLSPLTGFNYKCCDVSFDTGRHVPSY